MAPNVKSKKVGWRRIDAAIDALKPLGFSKREISKTINFLLKLYGDEGWVFIEESSYKMVIDLMLEQQEEDEKEHGIKVEEKAQDEAIGTEVGQQIGQPEEDKTTDDKTPLKACKQHVDPDGKTSWKDISIDQNSRHEETNRSYDGTPVNLEVTSSRVLKRRRFHGWISDSEDEDESKGPSESCKNASEQNNAKENRACAAVVENDEKGKATVDFLDVHGYPMIKDTRSQSVVKNEEESQQTTGDSLSIRDHQCVGHPTKIFAVGCQQTQVKIAEPERTKDVRHLAAADPPEVINKQDRLMNNAVRHIVNDGHQRIKEVRCGSTPSITRGLLAVDGRDKNSLAADNFTKEVRKAKQSYFLHNGNERGAEYANDSPAVNRQQQKPSIPGRSLALDSAHTNIEVHKDCLAVNDEHCNIKDGKSSFTVYNEQNRNIFGVNDVTHSPSVIGDCERVKDSGGPLASENLRGSHKYSSGNRMIKESGRSSEVSRRQEEDKFANGPRASTNAHLRIKNYRGCPESNEHKKIKHDIGHPADTRSTKMMDNIGSLAVSNSKGESSKHSESDSDVQVQIKKTFDLPVRKHHERDEGRRPRGSSVTNKEHDRTLINAPREISRDTRDSIYNSKHKGRSDSRFSSGVQYKLASSDDDDATGFSASKPYDGSSKAVPRGHFSFKAEQSKVGDLNGSSKDVNLKQRYWNSTGSRAFDYEDKRMMDSRDSLTNNYEQARFEKPKGTSASRDVRDKSSETNELGKIRIRKRPCGWDVTPTNMLFLY